MTDKETGAMKERQRAHCFNVAAKATAETKRYREQLKASSVRLHDSYATFRKYALILVRLSVVRYDCDKHRYEDCIHAAGRRVSMKERHTVAKFLRLQRNLEQQAMLLLELEHAIKHEEEGS